MAKFQPGNKAAVGRRPKTTLLSKLRDAVNPAWDDIVRAVIEQAKAGDMQAVTILANRVAPVPKSVGPAIQLDIDPTLNPAGRTTSHYRSDAGRRSLAGPGQDPR